MLVFERIEDKTHPYFEQAFAIYVNSFPVFERRAKYDQISALTDNEYHFIIIKNETEKLLGILLTWNKEDFIYVEHFAITPLARGKSIGTRILKYLKKVADKTILLEIDPPIDKVSIKRRAFYQRLGFIVSSKTHIHPSYRNETEAHKLVIMSYPELSDDVYDSFQEGLRNQIMEYSEIEDFPYNELSS